ncbi:hypothetical protein PCANC_18381 [Puccinia coronata f. sp. avenae]|uniref:Uncharacterized protein n=1 Tax=Puccinia coronata f. sp. avenae TaxID=200324 RepID=A0A2N5V1E0_9BASI|nr:hypothetical protein PCANC_18381 [Puccinia coronata f. sp. avenae]
MPLQPVNPISPPPPENQSLQRSLPLHVFPSLIPYHLRHLPYHLRCAPPVSPAMSYGLPNNTSITKDNPLPPGGNCFHSQPVDQIKFNIMRGDINHMQSSFDRCLDIMTTNHEELPAQTALNPHPHHPPLLSLLDPINFRLSPEPSSPTQIHHSAHLSLPRPTSFNLLNR